MALGFMCQGLAQHQQEMTRSAPARIAPVDHSCAHDIRNTQNEIFGSACFDSPPGRPKDNRSVWREGLVLINPTLHAHGQQLGVKRRLRWWTVVLAIANVALWSVVFGI
jgi:hypothetical protein